MTLADQQNMVDASGWYIFSTDIIGNQWNDLQNSWGITFAEIESNIYSISSSSPIDISVNIITNNDPMDIMEGGGTIDIPITSIPNGSWTAYDISTNPIIAPYTPYWVHVVNPNYGMTRIVQNDNGSLITKYIDVRGILGYNSYVNAVDIENMVSITVGDLVDTISYNAFVNSNVELVNISNKVEYIQSGAFKNCSNLTTVVFQEGSQVVTIDDIAFEGCSNLSDVYMTLSLYNKLYSRSIPNTQPYNWFSPIFQPFFGAASNVTIKPIYQLTKYTV